MRKSTIGSALLSVLILVVAVWAGDLPDSSAWAGEHNPRLSRTVVMSGLDGPWDLAFAPDGTMFFTEKCKGLSVRKTDGKILRLFGAKGAALEAVDFFCKGQSGMLGVTLDPDFAGNRFLYVYMASNLKNLKTNRVVRLTVAKNFTNVSNRKDIVGDIPFKASFNRWGGAGAHSGGRIRFSPVDGYLYVTTGDNHEGPLPQDLRRLGGKVLRIDRDGKPAKGNNARPGVDPRIFTYGHRNVQGIAFQPGTGRVFVSEHGPGHSDEVTRLVPGGNAGWDPAPGKGVSCASSYCGYISNRPDGRPTSMTDLERFPDALPPAWTNRGVSEGMGPCVFLTGSAWQAWEGHLAVGFLRGSRIELLALDERGMAKSVTVLGNLPKERMRSLVSGVDGSLWVATDAGEIWRLAVVQ